MRDRNLEAIVNPFRQPAVFNPFRRLAETKSSPHSRTLRTGFWPKIVDTFYVIAGEMIDEKSRNKNLKGSFGLIDYATLMIPAVITKLALWCYNNTEKSSLAVPGAMILTIPHAISFLGRYAAAILLTALASPIVGITYLRPQV
jgi:hypothetical protein